MHSYPSQSFSRRSAPAPSSPARRAGRSRARSIRRANRRRRCAIRNTASGPPPRLPKPSASAVRTRTSGSRATARRPSACATARSCARRRRIRRWRCDRDVRVRRPRDSQRRLGVRQQSAGHARGDQARHRRRHRRRARQRHREKARRAARAACRPTTSSGRCRSRRIRGRCRSRRKSSTCARVTCDDAEEPVGAVRRRVDELRARVEIPGDERRLVHRAGVPLHLLRRRTRPRAPGSR